MAGRSFADAAQRVALIDEPAGIVVHPRSGEIVALRDASTADVAALVADYVDVTKKLREWRAATEAELVRRLDAEGRRVLVVGAFEVGLKSGRTREWDPEALRGAVKDLVHAGVIDAGEIGGLLRTEIKVDGTLAARLLGRLSGDALAELQSCFEWKTSKPSVSVTAVPDLADALPEGGGR